jgi:3-hydroxyisobutyrate dehydrogenase-like beta-hydroxyacid dehydrogenase
MNIGFIGLGHMGSAMARNLLKAGHHVILHNRTRSKAEALASEGARVAKSVGGACRNEAVVTMLADDEALADAAFGEGKLIAELPRNAVHVSMSTISVALSDRLTEAHQAAGQAFVAARCSVGPKPLPPRSSSSSPRVLRTPLGTLSLCSTPWAKEPSSSARNPRRRTS